MLLIMDWTATSASSFLWAMVRIETSSANNMRVCWKVYNSYFISQKKEKQQKWVQLFIAEQHEWASIYFFKYPSLSVYYFKFHDFLILLKHILNTFF